MAYAATFVTAGITAPLWGHLGDRYGRKAMLLRASFGMAVVVSMMVANMSIEPIITVYVQRLVANPQQVSLVSGVVMSAAALGSVLSASPLGKLADRVGHDAVIVAALTAASLLLIPQAFVTSSWQLVGLRFAMGLALGGLLPCIAAVIRHNVPDAFVGMVLGYSLSFQFAGQVIGPLAGGFVGGHAGMRAVFFVTSVLLLLGAFYNGWSASTMSKRAATRSSRL